MRAPPPDFGVLRFWSDAHPANQRLNAWRGTLNETLITAEVDAIAGHTFHADAYLRILPEFRAGIGSLAPSVMRRTREIAAADNDDLYLLVNMEGVLEFTRSNTTFALEEGDGGIFSCRQEVAFVRKRSGRMMCLRVGHKRLSTLVPGLDLYSGEVIHRSSAQLRLLTAYVRELDQNQSLANADLRRLVTGHIYDLFALVLSSSLDATAFRLHAVEKYIADNLSREDLTIATVAAAQQLSPRQVQRLFEANGMTFSQYMLRKRLQNARNALIDPRQMHRSVGDIARASGFSSVPYFNRAFRRAYDASPSEVRYAATSPV